MLSRIVEVPCGYCLTCRKAKALEWSVRLQHELKDKGDIGMFVTLTYDEENVRRRGLYETLEKQDLIRYIKRLRNEGLKFTYYCVGEYGEKYQRPHYHCLFFGLDIRDKNVVKIVKEKWKYGLIDIGIVEVRSIHYCVGYIRKKLGGEYEKRKYRHKNPVFSIQSKGLGFNYIRTNRKYLDSNNCINLSGHKASIPRYYIKKNLIGREEMDEIQETMERIEFNNYVESGLTFEQFKREQQTQKIMHNVNLAWKNNNMRRDKL